MSNKMTPRKTSLTADEMEEAPIARLDAQDKIRAVRNLLSNFYAYKILDICWFEGDLPTDPRTPFSLSINPDWPERWQPPGSLHQFVHLSGSVLGYIARRLRRPTWTAKAKMKKLNSAEALRLIWKR